MPSYLNSMLFLYNVLAILIAIQVQFSCEFVHETVCISFVFIVATKDIVFDKNESTFENIS